VTAACQDGGQNTEMAHTVLRTKVSRRVGIFSPTFSFFVYAYFEDDYIRDVAPESRLRSNMQCFLVSSYRFNRAKVETSSQIILI